MLVRFDYPGLVILRCFLSARAAATLIRLNAVLGISRQTGHGVHAYSPNANQLSRYLAWAVCAAVSGRLLTSCNTNKITAAFPPAIPSGQPLFEIDTRQVSRLNELEITAGAKMSASPVTQDTSRIAVIVSQLLGVLIVIATVLTQQRELHSPRPIGNKTQVGGMPDGNGNRFALPWDDPLEDLRTFVPSLSQPSSTTPTTSATPPPSATPPLAESNSSRAPDLVTTKAPPVEQNQAKPLQVAPPTVNYIFLWNILDARPIPDEIERRLRVRYAIVSAVEAVGYLPYRESVLVPINLEGKLIGYFETFQAVDENASFQRVCLIWTPKHYEIEPTIIDKVTKQIRKLEKETAQGKVRILHYGTSDDLDYYLKTHKDFGSEAEISFMLATMPIASPSSTPPLLRPIVTDNVLVQRLATELKLRIPALNSENRPSETSPRIVIFTESNTKYSRAIVSELKKQLPNTRQEIYTYLRGLDGRPDDIRSTVTPDNSKRDVVESFLQARAISETSSGTSQFDYLRRTAAWLEGKKSRDRENRVVAVGILGSDIYDKMLVLQAVRPELPSAIFFTTDLEGIYLEREMQPFTRNLIVASAEGLDANNPDIKANWRLPPMRDSYQSVLVKEVQKILRPPANSEASPAQSAGAPSPTPPLGHIYEIAPGKNIELTSLDSNFLESWAPLLLRQLANSKFNFIIFLLGLWNGFLILWAISNREPAPSGRMKTEARIVVIVEIGLAAVAILFLLVKLLFSPAASLLGEPLTLGISIWPSVLIRLLAFLVAIALLAFASYSLIVHCDPQEANLKSALPKEMSFVSRFGTRTFHDLISKLFKTNTRWWWIVIISLFYLAISGWLFSVWPPTVPARGAWPFFIERIVLSLGVALYIIHLNFCLYLHITAFRLVRRLRLFFNPPAGQPAKATVETTAKSLESPAPMEKAAKPAEPSALEETANTNQLKATQMLESLSIFTTVIGKTLLYPLTVLILIILSRLEIFDNWVMTPSLTITFALGMILLIAASLGLWVEGTRLKRAVLAQDNLRKKEQKALEAINDGVFAAWYSQPIFSAILSALAVFGSLSVAGPLAKVFF